jgi:5-methylcytosine-specific restriction endonuclease McrA
MGMETKFCSCCQRTRLASDFNRRKASPDGLGYKCKSCEKEYRKANAARYKNLRREYYEAHRDLENERSLEYYRENRDRLIRQHAEYMRMTAAQQAAYRIENKDAYAARLAFGRAARSKRVPPWFTQDHFDQTRVFYQRARDATDLSGVPYQVDHIVPLRGKKVSGLHVPWNLQVITADENLRKGNRYEHTPRPSA